MRSPVDDGIITARALIGYRELVAEAGCDADALLEAVGLAGAGKETFDEFMSFRAFAELLELSAVRCGYPDFAMRLAARQNSTELMGPLGPLIRSAPTIEDVFAFSARFMTAYSSAVRTSFLGEDAQSGLLILRAELLVDHLPHRRQIIEHVLSLSQSAATSLSGGRVRAREVWFTHKRIAPRFAYRHFGTTLCFSEHSNAVLFSREDMKSKLTTFNEATFEREIVNLSENIPAQITSISRSVRTIISRQIDGGSISPDEVAAALGIRYRTLHRRLAKEGSSFSEILRDVRKDLLVHYLANSSISLMDIASRLGFSEPAALTHACHRWFSVGPRALRKMLEGAPE